MELSEINKENSFRLYADINNEAPTKELATALGIPDPEKRQPDLQYFTSVFVSSGYNLNSAFFLPSELILAEESVIDKPLDIEHEQDKIVGHLFSKVFAYKDRTVFDPKALYSSLGNDVEKVSMDIITSSRLYKSRFPEVALDVMSGKYKVSMECYYHDFDIIVDNVIIPKIEAKAVGLIEMVNNIVSVVEGKKSLGSQRVGRVLRGILFSGCGLVENPANPDSVILETAAVDNTKFILDLTKIDSYMKTKQEKESIVVHALKGKEKDAASISAAFGGAHGHEVLPNVGGTFDDGEHTHMVDPSSLEKEVEIFFASDGSHRHAVNPGNGKVAFEKEHTHKVYFSGEDSFYSVETSLPIGQHNHEFIEVYPDKRSDSLHDDRIDPEDIQGVHGCLSYGGIHSHILVLKDGTKLKTLVPTDIIKYSEENSMAKKNKATAGVGTADGKPLSTPDICVSFKRYIYENSGDNPGVPANADTTPGLVPQVESLPIPPLPGAGDGVDQHDKIVKENWCSLFDEPCPVDGGMAVHPDCIRLVMDKVTRDKVASYIEKLNENREKVGVEKFVASINKILEEANKKL